MTTASAAPPTPAPPTSSAAIDAVPMDAAARKDLIESALEFADRTRPSWPDPPILALKDADFAREVCRDDIPCDNVMAAYDTKLRRVLFRSSLDLKQVWERSFIVHELVHWLQHHARPEGVDDESCTAYKASEREAYTVQNRYLRHHQSGRRAGTVLNMLHC